MNERIKQLAEQAGFGIAGDPEYIHAMDYDGICTNELKMFAELMVKEFETVAKQQPWYYDAPSCGWRAPINHVCDMVKERFGVEND